MPTLHQPFGFRRMPALLLAITLVAVTVMTAGTGTVSPVHAQSDADVITIGMTDLPTSLDPGDAYDFNAWEVLSHLYTGLTRQVPGTFEYELVLAQDVSVSEDKLTYTFTLRDDISFSDGTPITAQTFVDSLNRVIALKHDAAKAVTPYVASVNAIDDLTLDYTLVQPVPYFLALVSLPPYFPQHPDLAATTRAQPFADSLTGNGPYALESFTVRDEIVLVANPAYTLGDAPKTGRIVLKYYERSQDLRNAMSAHEIDVAWRALLLSHAAELTANESITSVEVPSTRVFYLYFGQVREPTDDPLVREALTVLLERESAVDEVFDGHMSALTSLVPDFFPEAYYPRWPDEPDIDYAETTLGAAGYRERQTSRLGFTIAFSQDVYGVPYAAGVVNMARASFNDTDFIEFGVSSSIEPTAFFNVLEEGTGSVAIYAWDPIVPDPYAYLYPLLHSSQDMPTNSRYASAEIDRLLAQAAVAEAAEEQGAAYHAIADALYEDFAIAPLWQDHLQVLAWDDISGIQLEPNFFLHYDQLVRN